jgi:hypothetical protein
MTGVLDGIERVVIESKDGDLIATITEDEINWNPEFQVRIKSTVPKHRLFISCPTEGRTEDNIQKSFKKMLKIAEAYTGEKFKIVNPYIPKKPCGNADRIRYLADSINLMAGADYFIAPTDFWKYRECAIEEGVADKYGLKCLFADSEFATPDVPEHERPVCDH